jgi:hypothetical protein
VPDTPWLICEDAAYIRRLEIWSLIKDSEESMDHFEE